MPKLHDILAIPTEAADLLGAVGYLDAYDLIAADTEELQAELAKANDKLHITDADPTAEEIGEWKAAAKEDHTEQLESGLEQAETEPEDGPDQDAQPEGDQPAEESEATPTFVNFEKDPEVQEMLDLSPGAIPLDPSLIRRHKLKVADVPEGILLTECRGEVEINLAPPDRLTMQQKRESEVGRTGLMASRIRKFDEADEFVSHIKPLERGEARPSSVHSAGLNEGVSQGSRRFVRGVLHPDPWSVRISAFFALLVELTLVANFIGIPWLVWHDYTTGESMTGWVIGLSSGLLISALCYLFWGLSARCRVCGQRQFAPKKCLKNKKAHHIPVVGYIFPTALHAIFFKWFYCTYCGTAVRLKK